MLLAIAILAAFVLMPALEHKRYRDALNDAVRKLEPAAQRVRTLDRDIATNRRKIAALDDFRRRPQADLDLLNELTHLLPADVWTSSIEIYPDSIVISGECMQAAPLLKLIDSSPFFQNSEFVASVARSATAETFRIRATRRGRAGKTTP